MKYLLCLIIFGFTPAFAQNMPKLTQEEQQIYKSFYMSKQHREGFIAPLIFFQSGLEAVSLWALVNRCSEKISVKRHIPSVQASKIIDALALKKVENITNLELNANYQHVLSMLLVNSSLNQGEKAAFFALKAKYSKEIEIMNFVNFLYELENKLMNNATGATEYYPVARAVRYAKQLNIWEHMKPEKQEEAKHLEALSVYPQEKYAKDDIIERFVKKLADADIANKILEKSISKEVLPKINASKVLDKVEELVSSLAILPQPFTAQKICEKYPQLCPHNTRLEELASAMRIGSVGDLEVSQGFNLYEYYNKDCSLTDKAKTLVQE